jgi:hypothetical protein
MNTTIKDAKKFTPKDKTFRKQTKIISKSRGSNSKNPQNRARKPNKQGDIKCHLCAQLGHKRDVCPLMCNNKSCSKGNHLATDCYHLKKTEIVCHHCNTKGHKKSDCPKYDIVCALCKEKGHKRTACPDACNRDGCVRNQHTRLRCYYTQKNCSIPNIAEHISDEEDRTDALTDIQQEQRDIELSNKVNYQNIVDLNNKNEKELPNLINDCSDQATVLGEDLANKTMADFIQEIEGEPVEGPQLPFVEEGPELTCQPIYNPFDDISGDSDDSWFEFNYKQPFKWYEWRWLLQRFGWFKETKGRIPISLKYKLDTYIGVIRGYPGYMSFMQAVKLDEDVLNYCNHVFREDVVQKRVLDVSMYYWYTTTHAINTLEQASYVYNREITIQMESSKRLHTPIPIHIPWKGIAKVIIGCVVACVGVGYWRRAQNKQMAKNWKAVCGQKSLFPALGEHWVYIEEMLKVLPGFATLLDILENYKYGRNSEWHRRSMSKKFSARLIDHLHYNRSCESQNQNFYNIWVATGMWTPLNDTVDYVTNPRLLCSQIPYVKDMISQSASDIKEVYYYGICYNLSHFICPANTVENMKSSVFNRVLCVANTVTTERCQRDLTAALKLFCPAFDLLDKKEEWFSKLKTIQKYAILRDRLRESEGKCFTYIPASIKIDESLWGKDKRIPRFLCNLSGHWHDLLGSCFDQLSTFLTDGFFSGDDYCKINGQLITLTFAHGYTNLRLDKWFNSHLYRYGLHIICMGDDMMAIDNRSRTRFIECDFSKYDRTQNSYLLALFWRFLSKLGLHEISEVHQQMYKCKIKLPNYENHSMHSLNYQLEDVRMRYTGEAATCLANSVTNFLITALALTSEDPEQYYKDCGVLPKLYYKEAYTTFLKGVWLLGTDGLYHWTKLPSMFGKFGKSLTDPLSLYSKKHSTQRRYAQFLYCQLLGYGKFANNQFYRSIEKEIHRLTHERIGDKVNLIHHPWEIKNCEVVADVTEDFFNFVYVRYGFTDFDLLRIVEKYQSIQSIPCLFRSHELAFMSERDYG